MAYALIASVAAGSPDTFTFTTGSINTTGAHLLIAYVSERESVGDTTFSDSKGNTWAPLTERLDVGTASLRGVMYYATNVAGKVGAGHTFTVTDSSGGGVASVAVAAFSGAHLTVPLDQTTGTVDIDAGLSNTTGSITPTQNDELVVTGMAFSPNSATISIGSSYTITDQVDCTVNHKGVALAYLIQTSAGATNPTWSYSTNCYVVTTIASFKAAVSGGGGSISVPVFQQGYRRRRF